MLDLFQTKNDGLVKSDLIAKINWLISGSLRFDEQLAKIWEMLQINLKKRRKTQTVYHIQFNSLDWE